ncbi:type IV pilus twitching motility protein PilT [Gehongia tenuis]|uniref:PilT/PilU family type 4a pilus ATPase n=1 Tax=Gehongia tenuis TaxID=2763655 RepID=A0A926D689_9FIRM|nr:PilT/PilU family type 4a pilus ATPase [Gehongia tenuis]MBC8532016.1 PilT/PilU family type 4a pilus ATPase [Gehongia tenuis]
MTITEILTKATKEKASDVFLIANLPVSFKIDGTIVPQGEERLKPEDTYQLVEDIYSLVNHKSFEYFLEAGDDDFSFSLSGVGRFRINVYRQRNTLAAVIRTVFFSLPDPEKLGIPAEVMNAHKLGKGLVLVTGMAGCGKSTTLACIVDAINKSRSCHIITLEDPVEFIHRHNRSIVSQREIHSDTESYASALRAALRQSPDVILLGEMRDFETTNIAMTAAETGQLVLSSLHTLGAAKTIDRIIDVYPPDQQQQVRLQLSMVLEAVISQQLLPSADGGLVPAFEVMRMNPAIRNMIREGRIHQIDTAIYAGRKEGMIAMDVSVTQLREKGIISEETAALYASNAK